MSNAPSPAASHPRRSDLQDLEERLVRLRERMKREGRKTAIETIDRAIDEARRPSPAQKS